MDKNEFFTKRIRELANISFQRDIVTFSDFLNLNERNIVNSLDFRSSGVIVESFGGYDNAERQMVAFHSDALAYHWEYPIDCLRIRPRAVKFSETLTHRDYLGAILNLGVDRSVVGDILTEEKEAYLFCLQNDRFFPGKSFPDPSYRSDRGKNRKPRQASETQDGASKRNLCICAP